jgi:hypothetical protein
MRCCIPMASWAEQARGEGGCMHAQYYHACETHGAAGACADSGWGAKAGVAHGRTSTWPLRWFFMPAAMPSRWKGCAGPSTGACIISYGRFAYTARAVPSARRHSMPLPLFPNVPARQACNVSCMGCWSSTEAARKPHPAGAAGWLRTLPCSPPAPVLSCRPVGAQT